MKHWFITAALLITPTEMKSAECRVACEYSGYDSGYYADNKCGCVDFRDYEDATHRKRIILPHKHEKGSASKKRIYEYPHYEEPVTPPVDIDVLLTS
jgi:hypothetical protein